MNAVTTHLDDLLTVLRVSADLRATTDTVAQLRLQLIERLEPVRPDLASRVMALDDWHAEVLADFVADAQFVAKALDYQAPADGAEDDTRIG
jgi:hypothetical protein